MKISVNGGGVEGRRDKKKEKASAHLSFGYSKPNILIFHHISWDETRLYIVLRFIAAQIDLI